MQQLLRKRRIRFRQKVKDSNTLAPAWRLTAALISASFSVGTTPRKRAESAPKAAG